MALIGAPSFSGDTSEKPSSGALWGHSRNIRCKGCRPPSRSVGARENPHHIVMLGIRGAQAGALCKLHKLHKYRVVLVLSLP